MKRLVIVCSFLCVNALSALATQQDFAGEETLSPYFFIEDDESSLDSFFLEDTEVAVTISGVIADVAVRQHYVNRGGTAINGRYVFPGSTRAAVHGMRMIIGERVITATIKEKDEARKTFEKAKKEGKNASLLEQHRPNVFSMEVANIMPGDRVDIELRYTELLVPEKGIYEFVYPTVVGPRYRTLPAEGTPGSERWISNPYLKEGSEARTGFNIEVSLNSGIPVQEVVCTSHETAVTYDSESRARVSLADASSFGGDRDYILRYRLSGSRIASGLLLHKGEQENFFLLMAQPPKRVTPTQIPAREYIFVVDVSGSMHGFPLDTGKKLLEELIGGLKPSDTFNLMLFAGGSEVMAPASVPATPAQIRRAVKMINDRTGGGGTELLQAMNRAMALPRQEGVSRTMILVTDGYIAAEREVFVTIQENLSHTNVFAFGIGSSVNRFLIEGVARSGQGETFVVTRPDEAAMAADKFREYVAAPLLTDMVVSVDDLEVYDVEPAAIPDLFAQRPVLVFGKWRGEPRGSISVKGRGGDDDFQQVFKLEEADQGLDNSALRYLWARSRIARISDLGSPGDDPETRAEIVSLGLTYNLLTAFTSFVAVDEVIRNPHGAAKDVSQPLPLPKGVSGLAVSGGMQKAPEPGLLALFCGVLLLVVLGSMKRRDSGKFFLSRSK